MKIKTLVTAMLGITLVLPVMAQTDLASQDAVTDSQERRLVFNEDGNQLQSQSAGTLAGPHFEYSGDQINGGTVYYMDGRRVDFPNQCHTTINGSMRVIVTVKDQFGVVDYHQTRGTTNKWSAYLEGNMYECGISVGLPPLNGVGTYEAVFERSGYSPVKEVIKDMPACYTPSLQELYAQRRASDSNFFMTIDVKEYSRAYGNGFTETFGAIGKTLKKDKYNGSRKLSIGMERYDNPVMTTHAAAIDLRDQETHPAWVWNGSLGHIYTKQYNGTIPLYRAYGEYNPSDWEVGLTTDYNYYMYIITGSGWTPLGTAGHPQGVLGYVCPAN